MQTEDSIWPPALRAMDAQAPDVQATNRSSNVTKIQQAIDDASLWLWFSLAGAGGASVLALGMLLRSNRNLSARLVLGTVLHAAAWAIGVFLLSYNRFTDDLAFLLGVSIMSGMGAASFVDLALLVVRQRMGAGLPPDPFTDARPRRKDHKS